MLSDIESGKQNYVVHFFLWFYFPTIFIAVVAALCKCRSFLVLFTFLRASLFLFVLSHSGDGFSGFFRLSCNGVGHKRRGFVTLANRLTVQSSALDAVHKTPFCSLIEVNATTPNAREKNYFYLTFFTIIFFYDFFLRLLLCFHFFYAIFMCLFRTNCFTPSWPKESAPSTKKDARGTRVAKWNGKDAAMRIPF